MKPRKSALIAMGLSVSMIIHLAEDMCLVKMQRYPIQTEKLTQKQLI